MLFFSFKFDVTYLKSAVRQKNNMLHDFFLIKSIASIYYYVLCQINFFQTWFKSTYTSKGCCCYNHQNMPIHSAPDSWQEPVEKENHPMEFLYLLPLSQNHCKGQRNTAFLKSHHCLHSGNTVEWRVLQVPKAAAWTQNASRQEMFLLSGCCMDWRIPL